jgi:electron transport complex protein RnfG
MRKIVCFALGILGLCALSPGNCFIVREAAAGDQRTAQEIELAWLLKQALPGADRYQNMERGGIQYEVGYRGDEVVGGVFHTEGTGYKGPMQFMVGLDPQGRVVEIVLVSHRESRGLGTKVADPVFLSQFRGRSGPFVLKQDDPLGNIDGIAKATMSTRGLIMAVEEAQRIFRQVWERPE